MQCSCWENASKFLRCVRHIGFWKGASGSEMVCRVFFNTFCMVANLKLFGEKQIDNCVHIMRRFRLGWQRILRASPSSAGTIQDQ